MDKLRRYFQNPDMTFDESLNQGRVSAPESKGANMTGSKCLCFTGYENILKLGSEGDREFQGKSLICYPI